MTENIWKSELALRATSKDDLLLLVKERSRELCKLEDIQGNLVDKREQAEAAIVELRDSVLKLRQEIAQLEDDLKEERRNQVTVKVLAESAGEVKDAYAYEEHQLALVPREWSKKVMEERTELKRRNAQLALQVANEREISLKALTRVNKVLVEQTPWLVAFRDIGLCLVERERLYAPLVALTPFVELLAGIEKANPDVDDDHTITFGLEEVITIKDLRDARKAQEIN